MKLKNIEKAGPFVGQLHDHVLPIIFDEENKSKTLPSEFFADNGLFNHEPGVLMFYDDGPLERMVSIPDVQDFVTYLMEANKETLKDNSFEAIESLSTQFLRKVGIDFGDDFFEVTNGFSVDDEGDFLMWETGPVMSFYVIPDSKIPDLVQHPAFEGFFIPAAKKSDDEQEDEYYPDELDYHFLADISQMRPKLVDEGLLKLADSGANFRKGLNFDSVELAHDPAVHEKLEQCRYTPPTKKDLCGQVFKDIPKFSQKAAENLSAAMAGEPSLTEQEELNLRALAMACAKGIHEVVEANIRDGWFKYNRGYDIASELFHDTELSDSKGWDSFDWNEVTSKNGDIFCDIPYWGNHPEWGEDNSTCYLLFDAHTDDLQHITNEQLVDSIYSRLKTAYLGQTDRHEIALQKQVTNYAISAGKWASENKITMDSLRDNKTFLNELPKLIAKHFYSCRCGDDGRDYFEDPIRGRKWFNLTKEEVADVKRVAKDYLDKGTFSPNDFVCVEGLHGIASNPKYFSESYKHGVASVCGLVNYLKTADMADDDVKGFLNKMEKSLSKLYSVGKKEYHKHHPCRF